MKQYTVLVKSTYSGVITRFQYSLSTNCINVGKLLTNYALVSLKNEAIIFS